LSLFRAGQPRRWHWRWAAGPYVNQQSEDRQPMNENIEVNKTIYEQDCEFYRYQDGLKWSRFQTAATIEGAVLFALYQAAGLGKLEQHGLMVFGFVLVLIICLSSLKDETDANSHVDRMKKFESLGEPFFPRKWPRFLSGTVMMWTSIVLLNLFNVIVLIYKW
jgi:hypothetical protein